MAQTHSPADQEHERLQKLLQRAHSRDGQAKADLAAAERRDAAVADYDREEKEYYALTTDKQDARAILIQEAVQLRERAETKAMEAAELHRQAVEGWQTQPNLRPDWAPKPTMAEELKAAELRRELQAREERERDRLEGRIREEGRER